MLYIAERQFVTHVCINMYNDSPFYQKREAKMVQEERLGSFIDNFEWNEGFDMRFGLVEVDPKDPELKRKPRRSASLYSRIIRANGIERKLR